MPLNTKKIDLCSFRLAFELEQEFKNELIENEVYFRGSLHSLSLISISKNKPEMGVIYRNYRSRSLDILNVYIQEIKNKQQPKRLKPEKSLQAWIIKQTQLDSGFLPFNQSVKFITSELAIKNDGVKYIANIIGYDIHTQQIVIIEIKSNRLFNRLKEQVDKFAEIFTENYALFQQLIQLHGFSELAKIPRKVIVWPMARTSPLEKWAEAGVREYTYQEQGEGYSFKNHSVILTSKEIKEKKEKLIKEFVQSEFDI